MFCDDLKLYAAGHDQDHFLRDEVDEAVQLIHQLIVEPATRAADLDREDHSRTTD